MTVRLSTGWIEALDRKAAELGMTRSDLIRSSVPLEEQLVKSDVRPAPTRTVPRGETHDRTENLVGKNMGQQSAPIEGHDINRGTETFPRDNKTASRRS